VVLEVPQVGEALATFVAHVLLLAAVDLQVGLQAVALVEAAAALLAAEGLLARVDALVAVQVARVAEALPARVAAERLLTRVDRLAGSRGHVETGREKLNGQCMLVFNPSVTGDTVIFGGY